MNPDHILDPECCYPFQQWDDEAQRLIIEWKISPYARQGDYDKGCYWLTESEFQAACREAEALQVTP